MRLLAAAVAAVVLVGACGADESRPEEEGASASEERSDDNGADSTTTTKTTTTMTTTTTTTLAPEPEVYAISRDTAIAAQQCIDGWHSARTLGQLEGFVNSAELDSTDLVCEEASTLLDIDLIGVPTGPSPPRSLAVLLSSINLAIGFENLTMLVDPQCTTDGYCAVPPTRQEEFLDLDDVVDSRFREEPLLAGGAGLDDIDGLVVE